MDNKIKVIFLDIDGVLNDDITIDQAWAGVSKGLWELETVGDGRWFPPGWTMIQASMVQHLQTVIDVTGAKIVLSSSWRLSHDLNEMTAFLHKRGLRNFQIIGATPIGIDDDPPKTEWDWENDNPRLHAQEATWRGDECQKWLDDQTYWHVESYVIVDDNWVHDPEIPSEINRRFVQTKANHKRDKINRGGIGKAEAERMIKILKTPLEIK